MYTVSTYLDIERPHTICYPQHVGVFAKYRAWGNPPRLAARALSSAPAGSLRWINSTSQYRG
jgi:hypothetical protein